MALCNYFGIICACIVTLQFIKSVFPWLYQNLIGPKLFGPTIKLKNLGEWALITGATEGIGKAYAKALAKHGLNLVLVSRSQEKLDKVANEISKDTEVKIKTIEIDFTKSLEIYEKIEKSIADIEIAILVNNVGISYKNPEYFLSIPNKETFFSDIISCNISSVLHMCKIILPGMVKRKKGVIINISSMAAVIPNPMLSVYSASKAFIDKFSEDLSTEYKQHGIIVQSILPGFVATNMSKIKKPTIMAPSADTYVSSALKTIGIATHTTGYFPHAILKFALDAIQYATTTSIANNFVLKQMENIERRAARKSKSS